MLRLIPIYLGLAIIGVIQFYAERRNRDIAAEQASIRQQILAERASIEVLSDQLNTVGRDDNDPQRQARNLLRQMRQIGSGFIVILGDSITERAQLPASLCGSPLINAGIGGSRTSNFIPLVEQMGQFSPRLIVVALGINDTSRTLNTDFASLYNVLLDSLPRVSLMLVGLTPVDYSGVVGSRLDPDKVKAVDAFIRSSAKARELPFVDMNMPNFTTLDGVHLTVGSYARWNKALLAGIKKSLNCNDEREGATK